jgi:hypothetical protein
LKQTIASSDMSYWSRAFLAGREREHVNAFGLKTIPWPRNQSGTHIMRGNFNPVVQTPDRAARPNLVVSSKACAPFFVNHKSSLAA